MKVIVCGDYSPQGDVTRLLDAGRTDEVFPGLRRVLDTADYRIVNFESVVARPSDRPVIKDGSHMSCPPGAVSILADLGFDCVTLANNHVLDYGGDALARTIGLLEERGIDHVGAGRDRADAARTLFREIAGVRLAVVNCCEREYNIAGRDTPGANPVDPVEVYNAIRSARSRVDHVLVIVHGGPEHMQLPSPRMQRLYRFFIDAGADAVVNHHQHCLSGWETYRGRPIVYGLGNFFFNLPDTSGMPWNRGIMAMLDFGEPAVSFTPIPFRQCDGAPEVTLLDPNAFDAEIERLNAIIADPDRLEREYEVWMDERRKQYIDIFLPLRGWSHSRRLRLLQRLRLAPDIDFGPSLKYMLNCVRCESHNERLIRAMEQHIRENEQS